MAKKGNTYIEIKGANANNLQNVDLQIPKNQLVVVTGVSGSGKSSITIDTLYAEGQRRYVESLSSYARQFLTRMKKPEVDYIKGICPAIAIEQKVSTSNARSTVGSLTEVYDFLRLLYARVGKTYSPVSGSLVKKHVVSDVVDYICEMDEGEKILLLIPLHQQYSDRKISHELDLLLQKGYPRVLYQGEQMYIEDLLDSQEQLLSQKIEDVDKESLLVLIDRFVVKHGDDENKKRIADSVSTAFIESGGECFIHRMENEERRFFNNRFELDGITFIEPTPHLFNYNNPFGACPRCEGFGRVMGIDEDKVIPDPTLSVFDGAVQCWKGEKSSKYLQRLLNNAHHFDFPVHRSYEDLTEEQKDLLWDGNRYFDGIHEYFDELEKKTYKIQNRVMIARYRGRTICQQCRGSRLRKEAQYVKVSGKSIKELIYLPIDQLLLFIESIQLDEYDMAVARRILIEITSRLKNLMLLGLDYLHLDRLSSTLSGGETQRINLTKCIGSNLTNSMYILDEPSIGLHARDTEKLVEVLKSLRDLNNTVIVVEHEEDVIRNADFLVDMGPAAGIHGGKIVYAGPYTKLNGKLRSLTAEYLSYRKFIALPERRRKGTNKIKYSGIKMHNLHNVDVEIPLNTMTVVSGVSGSGKSTLVHNIIYDSLKDVVDEPGRKARGNFKALSGDVLNLTQIEMINQRPIGKSSRSNPVTYVKAYDAIRKLMTNQQLSKIRGYKPKHFSFNVEGGRCDTCQGEGEIVVEMQFLADVRLQCEDCKGQRFKNEILEVKFKGKNIADILNMSIEEAIGFFEGLNEIVYKLKPLDDVGLGYVKLGQSSSTLSGGEAQRVKLASFLGRERANEHIMFIFDEPTTGLHFHDVGRLLEALNALVEQGHTVLVVEHNLDVIKSADWVIDLGPGGGRHGGKVLFQGLPEELIKDKESVTATYLKEKIESVRRVQQIS